MAYRPIRKRRRAKLLTDTKGGIREHFAACGNAPRRVKAPNRTSVFGQGAKDGKWQHEHDRTKNQRMPRVDGAVAVPFRELLDSVGTRAPTKY